MSTLRVSKPINYPPNVSFLNNYCGYYIKELLMVFDVWITWSKRLGYCSAFEIKAKNTHLVTCAFLRFSAVFQHPACLDHVILKHGKRLGISLFVPSNEVSTLKNVDFVCYIGNTPTLLMQNIGFAYYFTFCNQFTLYNIY